jgi:nuclear pore complex protein Nup133
MSSGGRTTPSAHPFVRARPSAGLSRFLPGVLWGGNGGSGIGEEDPESISAVALGEVDETGRDVWALTETRLQRWRLLAEGSEQRVSEERIDRIISRAVKVAFAGSAPKDEYEFDLELVDLVTARYVGSFAFSAHSDLACSSEELLTLVSFAGNEDKDVLVRGDHPRRIYVIVRISYTTDSPEVVGISAVPYQSVSLTPIRD